jgi:hypothetical protein
VARADADLCNVLLKETIHRLRLPKEKPLCYSEAVQGSVEYANWLSKLLFQKNFERQFFIPIPPSKIESWIFRLIERTKFNLDLSGLGIEKPVFIVGLPRSGTSLLYNLLCAHEQAAFVTNSINAVPEAICTIEWLRKSLNLNIRGERFLADSIITDFGSPSEPVMFWGKWIGRDVESLSWDEKRIQDFSKEKIEEIYTDIRKILFCFGGEGRRFICKYPVIQTELRMIQDLFPDAKFVHILRDGRYTANSLRKLYHLCNDQLKKINHPWVKHVYPYPRIKNLRSYIETYGPESLETTARIWEDSVHLVRQTAPDLRHYTEIRYEDLLARPKEELEKLFRFCELPWPAPANEKFAHEFSLIGKTFHKNSYKDFELIEKIVGPTLKDLGYN